MEDEVGRFVCQASEPGTTMLGLVHRNRERVMATELLKQVAACGERKESEVKNFLKLDYGAFRQRAKDAFKDYKEEAHLEQACAHRGQPEAGRRSQALFPFLCVYAVLNTHAVYSEAVRESKIGSGTSRGSRVVHEVNEFYLRCPWSAGSSKKPPEGAAEPSAECLAELQAVSDIRQGLPHPGSSHLIFFDDVSDQREFERMLAARAPDGVLLINGGNDAWAQAT
eukprot:5680941-Prymnesium_polylepis.1